MSAIGYEGDCPLCGKRHEMFHKFAGKRICYDCDKYVRELKKKWWWSKVARKMLHLAKQMVKDSVTQPTPFEQALDYAAEEWEAEE